MIINEDRNLTQGSTFAPPDRGGAELLVSNLDAAYNLARWLMRDAAEAEDVVQDAYLRAVKHYAGFRGGGGKSWLLAIVRNRCYDRLRQKGFTDRHQDFDETVHGTSRQAHNPESAVLAGERRELLRKSLAELPAEYREVLVLRELEQLSYQEIADVAGIPMGTVMSRLNRGRQRLQQTLHRHVNLRPISKITRASTSRE